MSTVRRTLILPLLATIDEAALVADYAARGIELTVQRSRNAAEPLLIDPSVWEGATFTLRTFDEKDATLVGEYGLKTEVSTFKRDGGSR